MFFKFWRQNWWPISDKHLIGRKNSSSRLVDCCCASAVSKFSRDDKPWDGSSCDIWPPTILETVFLFLNLLVTNHFIHLPFHLGVKTWHMFFKKLVFFTVFALYLLCAFCSVVISSEGIWTKIKLISDKIFRWTWTWKKWKFFVNLINLLNITWWYMTFAGLHNRH